LSYRDCDSHIIAGLIATASEVFAVNGPQTDADRCDVELILDALRVLRPTAIELESLSALLSVSKGDWNGAISALTLVVTQSPQYSNARSLLAYCQAMNGMSIWRQTLAEAPEGSPEAPIRRMEHVLTAREDWLEALRTYEAGGGLHVPLSVATINDNEPD
jgi:type III secretion system HrpB1/HrpK family protein